MRQNRDLHLIVKLCLNRDITSKSTFSDYTFYPRAEVSDQTRLVQVSLLAHPILELHGAPRAIIKRKETLD